MTDVFHWCRSMRSNSHRHRPVLFMPLHFLHHTPSLLTMRSHTREKVRPMVALCCLLLFLSFLCCVFPLQQQRQKYERCGYDGQRRSSSTAEHLRPGDSETLRSKTKPQQHIRATSVHVTYSESLKFHLTRLGVSSSALHCAPFSLIRSPP
jgi:hypothetical protein